MTKELKNALARIKQLEDELANKHKELESLKDSYLSDNQGFEEELKRLSLVTNYVNNGVLLTNAEGEIIWSNEGFTRLAGYSFQELKGKKPGTILQGKATDPAVKKQISQAIKKKEPISTQILNYHKNGSSYWIQLDIIPLFDVRGELDCFIGIQTNIDKQKQVETVLKTALQLQNAFFDHFPGVIYILDQNKNLEFLNHYLVKLIGKSKEELIGKNIEELNQIPNSSYKFPTDYEGILKNGESIFLNRAIQLEEKIIYFNSSKFLIQTENENNHIGVFSLDVTDAIQAKIQIETLEHILDESINDIFIFDAQNFHILFANENALNYAGYSPELIYQQLTYFDLFPQFTPAKFSQLIESLIKQKQETIYFETQILKNDQSLGEVRIQLHRALFKNTFALVVFMTDISEDKKYQEELYFHSAILTQVKDSVIVTDLKGLIVYYNQGAEKTFGYTWAEVIGKSPQIFYPDYEITSFIKNAYELEGAEYKDIWRGKNNLGVNVWIDITNTLLRNTKGEIIGVLAIGKEITDRYNAERLLEETAHIAKIGGWEMDINLSEFTFTKEAYRIYHFPLGKKISFADFISLHLLDYQSIIKSNYLDCQNKGKLFNLEVQISLAQDTSKWVAIKGFPVLSNGKITKLKGSIQDISLEKQKEQQLQSSKHFIDNVADTSPSILYVYDRELKRYTYINQQITNTLGYSLADLEELEDGLYDLYHPADLPLTYTLESKLEKASNEEIIKSEFRLKHKNGKWLWMAESSKVFMRNPNGSVKQIIGVLEDITVEKQAKVKLLESLTDLQNIQRALNASALISITDLEGNILRVNKAFSKASQYMPRELIGQNHRVVNSGIHTKDFHTDMWEAIRKGKYWHGEICNKAKDNSIFWVDATICPIRDVNGQIYQYLSVQYLITERKNAEDHKNQLVKDLSDFAFMTSHNLRRPLANILGLISIFDYEIVDNPLNFSILQKLKQSAEELDVVIYDMNELLERNSLLDKPQI